MMELPPARRIAGTAYLTDRNTPSRLTAVCRRQSASDISIVLMKKKSRAASAADFTHHCLAAGIVQVGYHHLSALTRQCGGTGCTNSGCAPCYDGDLALYLTHSSSPRTSLIVIRHAHYPYNSFSFTEWAQCHSGSEAARHRQLRSQPGSRSGVAHRRPTPLSCRNEGMTKRRLCGPAARPGSLRLRRP